jgi:YNFM family putative membrane transporter
VFVSGRTTSRVTTSDGKSLAALYVATVAVYSDLYITQPFLPVLSRRFDVSPSTAGLSVSVVVLMIAVVSPVWGSLSDSAGRKPVLVASVALLTVPTLLGALAPSFGVLLALRSVQGLLIPGLTAVAVALLGDHYHGADLPPRVAAWIGASVVGGLTGRVVSGTLAGLFDWHAPFLVFGGLTAAGALGMALFLPAGPKAAVRPRPAWRELAAHLRSRRLLGAFLIGAALLFSFIAVFTYLPYYLSAPPFGLSTAAVSSFYFAYVGGIVTSFVVPRLPARYSGRRLMTVGLVVAGAGVVSTLVRSVPVIGASLVIVCVGMFLVQATAPAFVNLSAATAKGAAGSLYVTFYYLGATAGSFLPGLAYQRWAWPGVVAACVAARAAASAANRWLCA